jgi:hypothetical protein
MHSSHVLGRGTTKSFSSDNQAGTFTSRDKGLNQFQKVQTTARKSRRSIKINAAASSTAKKAAAVEKKPVPAPAAKAVSSVIPKEKTILLQGETQETK